MNKIVKEKIKQAFLLFIIIISFVCVLAIMLKYETEGEKNMPFSLEEMLIVSSADGQTKSENSKNYKWNMDINQYNDIYIKIKRNENYKEQAYIESISIENINYSNPKKGTIEVYMPNSTEEKLFSYEKNFIVNNSLTYKGANTDNSKALEIGNQGGTLLFRVLNKNVAEYVSNDDDEISYNGTLLKKLGLNEEDITIDVSFDIVIRTNKTKFRGKINVKLPCSNLLEEGVSKIDITDFSNIIFKREK